MKRVWCVMIGVSVLGFSGGLFGAGSCFAASGSMVMESQDEKGDLNARFQERYRPLMKYKDEGRVGETFEGYVAALTETFLDDAELASFIDAENDDRERLYELLAGEVKDEVQEPSREQVTPEIVAERNAKRSFRNAKNDHFLRMQDGVWVQKADEQSYEKILELKEKDGAEEKDDGYLEATGDEAETEREVDEENDRRRGMYEDIAEEAEVSTDDIAREHGEAHMKAARGE